jgi:uncharacterized membrane protein
MVTLIELSMVIVTALSLNSADAYQSIEADKRQNESAVLMPPGEFAKEKALKILDNKCNVCHRKRNKRRVFTAENMDTWANDIYKQVFVKKRMPKGKKIKLNTNEYPELLTWISTTKK